MMMQSCIKSLLPAFTCMKASDVYILFTTESIPGNIFAVSTFEQPKCKKRKRKERCGKCNKYVRRLEQEMVQCDHCDQWYHYICVGLTAKQAQSMAFVCPNN